MDWYDNATNKRIMRGQFPDKKLLIATVNDPCEETINLQTEEGIKLLEKNPELFNYFFLGFRNRVKEIDLLEDNNLYFHPINCYINTKNTPEMLNDVGVVQEAIRLNPVVTQLDRILWYGASSYYLETLIASQDRLDETTSLMYAWCYLLRHVQEKELETSATINPDAIKSADDTLSVILDWDIDEKVKTRSLLEKTQYKLKNLVNERKKLCTSVIEERQASSRIAEKTNDNWKLFLRLLNDLSDKEACVVRRINEATSVREKRKAIYDYEAVLNEIKKGRYTIDDTTLSLIDVFEAVNDRFARASYYTYVQAEEGDSFRLSPVILELVMDPKTYNYYFMKFHQFRMSPNKDCANQFVSLAVSCIKRNLGGEEKNAGTLDEKIAEFCNAVISFVDSKKEVIEKLAFDRIQDDTVLVDQSVIEVISADLNQVNLIDKLKGVRASGAPERELEAIINGEGKAQSKDEIKKQIEQEEKEQLQQDEIVVAQQVIASLNIIYLFCDALRIIINDKHANIKADKEKAQAYRQELIKLEMSLVRKVYGEKEYDLLESREERGVIYSSISEQELHEEELRSDELYSVLKDEISELVQKISTKDVEGIIEVKNSVKHRIEAYPDLDRSGSVVAWIDSISEKVNEELVKNCRNDESFSITKNNLLNSLGEKSSNLPISTIDSLTTAEMLYTTYATEVYANQGFDYSCISALYYQAFEDGYNELIWHEYADRLKNKPGFLDLLYKKYKEKKQRKNIDEEEYLGYLSMYYGKRKEYLDVDREKKQVSIRTTCMYNAFINLMKSVTEPNDKDPLTHFQNYLAEKTGYTDGNKMLEDTTFISKCKEFVRSIEVSKDYRNNASHGGSYIDISQCKKDKKMVLNDLEVVRSSSIGLIQQLLYLLYKD